MISDYGKGDAIKVKISVGKGSDPNKGSEQYYRCEDITLYKENPDITIFNYVRISDDLDDVSPIDLSIGVSRTTKEHVWQRGVMDRNDPSSVVNFEFIVDEVIKANP